MRLEYNYKINDKANQAVLEMEHVGPNASFVWRGAFGVGVFGVPNYFIIYQDPTYVVLYVCQSQLLFFNKQYASIFARSKFANDPDKMDFMLKYLHLLNRNFKIFEIEQRFCPSKVGVGDDND